MSFSCKKLAVYLSHSSVSCWDLQASQAEELAAALPEYELLYCRSKAEFIAALKSAEIAISWNFEQSWIDQAANLRLIVTPAAGSDYFQVNLPAHIASWNSHFHGELIAETAVGALLGICRGLFFAVDNFSEYSWPRAQLGALQTTLRNSTVMILGFGAIGECIARQVKNFSAKIIAVKRQLNIEVPAYFDSNDKLISVTDMDKYLPETEHLIVVLPRNPETEMIIDKRRLALLPDFATVSNYGRGNAIDTAALCETLQNNKLKAAFLDVFPEEPLPENSPLLKCKNLWRLPHLSAAAPDYLNLFIKYFVEKLNG
jgi:phosphoglycerate dehydrogenase-like enzyme